MAELRFLHLSVEWNTVARLLIVVWLVLWASEANAGPSLACDPKENATVCELMVQRNNAMNELADTAAHLRVAHEDADGLRDWWAKYVAGVSAQVGWWQKYADGVSAWWGQFTENSNAKSRH